MPEVLQADTHGSVMVADRVDPGTKVEVRQRFDQGWARGFEVVEVREAGYQVRRLSDGMVLPTEFLEDDVRVEHRRKQGLWWY